MTTCGDSSAVEPADLTTSKRTCMNSRRVDRGWRAARRAALLCPRSERHRQTELGRLPDRERVGPLIERDAKLVEGAPRAVRIETRMEAAGDREVVLDAEAAIHSQRLRHAAMAAVEDLDEQLRARAGELTTQ